MVHRHKFAVDGAGVSASGYKARLAVVSSRFLVAKTSLRPSKLAHDRVDTDGVDIEIVDLASASYH